MTRRDRMTVITSTLHLPLAHDSVFAHTGNQILSRVSATIESSVTTSSEPSAQSEATIVPTRKQFFFLLVVYFGLHVVTRTLVSETAGIDEADQLVLGQKLAWGYGPQAPLYTWLMTL